MNVPLISIVVCTFNRAAMLREAIASLTSQRFDAGEFEIVVIDNGSSDNTAETLRELALECPIPLRSFLESRPGVACARNRGLAEARGQWIAFFDDDQIADQRWLTKLLEMAQSKQVSCVGGAVTLLLDDAQQQQLPSICRQALGATIFLDREQPYAGDVMPGTGNLLLHRNVIARVGGFDETLVEAGEDTDLFRRIRAAGFVAWFTPHAIVRHQVPPDRLEPKYFYWTSRRSGWIRARLDVIKRGMPRTMLNCAARGLQAALIHVPTWMVSTVRGRSVDVLGARCALLRFEGYCRSALYHLSPRTFPNTKFREAHSFRAERAKSPAKGIDEETRSQASLPMPSAQPVSSES